MMRMRSINPPEFQPSSPRDSRTSGPGFCRGFRFLGGRSLHVRQLAFEDGQAARLVGIKLVAVEGAPFRAVGRFDPAAGYAPLVRQVAQRVSAHANVVRGCLCMQWGVDGDISEKDLGCPEWGFPQPSSQTARTLSRGISSLETAPFAALSKVSQPICDLVLGSGHGVGECCYHR